MEPSKAPITRSALERVLARAAELQAASGDDPEPDTLTEAQVVDLGREVGLSASVIRQALAEERSRVAPVPPDTGLLYHLAGGSQVSAQRMVPGPPTRILETLDRWMQRDELLRVVRQRSEALVWEPTRGILGNLRRAFGSKDYALSRANTITATAVPVDGQSTLVRLEADFTRLRGSVLKQAVSGGVVGGVLTGAALIANVMVPVALVPFVAVTAGSYVGSRRAHRHAMERALLTLEQLLDRLERGEMQPPSLMRLIESALPSR